MDKKLKNSFEDVHAPESLFQDTLNKMYAANAELQKQEELELQNNNPSNTETIDFQKENQKHKNNSQNKPAKSSKKRWIYTAAAIAACLCAGIITLLVLNGGNTIKFNSTNLTIQPNTVVRAVEAEISEDEYHELSGRSTDSLKTVEGFSEVSCYADETANLTQAIYNFIRKGSLYSLTEQNLVPEELNYIENPEVTSINGTDVIFVESQSLGTLSAIWKLYGTYYVLQSPDPDKDSFVSMTKDLIRALSNAK